MPEGWAHTWLQTESLMRLTATRGAAAQSSAGHGAVLPLHYEHGVVPGECGIADEPGGWQLKSLCLTRALCLWLNKGVDVMHYFCAYDRQALGMGLLPPGLPKLPPESRFEEAGHDSHARPAKPHADAGRQRTDRAAPRVIDRRCRVGPQKSIFAGDATHPPLWHRDAVAVLPFQITPGRFALVAYVMTYDATQPLAEERYRLTIGGLHGPRIGGDAV